MMLTTNKLKMVVHHIWLSAVYQTSCSAGDTTGIFSRVVWESRQKSLVATEWHTSESQVAFRASWE